MIKRTGGGAGVGTKGAGVSVAVAKGRVPKDAPVVGVAVANGAVSALPLGSFPDNLINTVLSPDSPNVSFDFCNFDILCCT